MVAASLLLVVAALAGAPQTPATQQDPAGAFFASGPVVRVEITLSAADRQRLRDAPREYVTAAVRIDDVTAARAGIKLKGAAGSFREIDDRPGFTVHLGKFGDAVRLHGLQRFHLNNCAQDESHLSEWLGHEVFQAAGLPAPRVAHALVSLDGKQLGLYVLREAFDAQFVQRTFGHTNGNLYDGGFCQDIDADLEKDAGDGPAGRPDLQALRQLCQGVDRDRVEQLAKAIDIEQFLGFLALEAMLDHWDGYSRNSNNYRLWCDARSGRAVFLPHGMDQLFGDNEVQVLAHPQAIVASAVLQQPAYRKRYRERLKELLPLFDPKKLGPKVDAKGAQLRKALTTVDREAALREQEAVKDLLQRIAARNAYLVEQSRAPEPRPVEFPNDKPIALKKWRPAAESDDVALAKKAFGNVPSLQIASTKRTDEPKHAAWRTSMLLGKGRYRFVARARSERIDPLLEGGASLRALERGSDRVSGDADWRELACEFEVVEFQRDVELSLQFDALSGKVWFRTDSLQLFRLPQ